MLRVIALVACLQSVIGCAHAFERWQLSSPTERWYAGTWGSFQFNSLPPARALPSGALGQHLAAMQPVRALVDGKLEGFCQTWRGEQMLEQEVCYASDHCATEHLCHTTYVWPSGAETVLELYKDVPVELNGKPTRRVTVRGHQCVWNDAKRYTFCFTPQPQTDKFGRNKWTGSAAAAVQRKAVKRQRTTTRKQVWCQVWRRGRLKDEDPCKFDEQCRGKKVCNWTFTWPSGSKTVMRVRGSTLLSLNGKRSTLVKIQGRTCFRNESTKNVFCYLEKAVTPVAAASDVATPRAAQRPNAEFNYLVDRYFASISVNETYPSNVKNRCDLASEILTKNARLVTADLRGLIQLQRQADGCSKPALGKYRPVKRVRRKRRKAVPTKRSMTTKFVVGVPRRVEHEIKVLRNPTRIAIELPFYNIVLPSLRKFRHSNVVGSFYYEVPPTGARRLTIELKQSVKVRSYYAAKRGWRGYDLTVELTTKGNAFQADSIAALLNKIPDATRARRSNSTRRSDRYARDARTLTRAYLSSIMRNRRDELHVRFRCNAARGIKRDARSRHELRDILALQAELDNCPH